MRADLAWCFFLIQISSCAERPCVKVTEVGGRGACAVRVSARALRVAAGTAARWHVFSIAPWLQPAALHLLCIPLQAAPRRAAAEPETGGVWRQARTLRAMSHARALHTPAHGRARARAAGTSCGRRRSAGCCCRTRAAWAAAPRAPCACWTASCTSRRRAPPPARSPCAHCALLSAKRSRSGRFLSRPATLAAGCSCPAAFLLMGSLMRRRDGPPACALLRRRSRPASSDGASAQCAPRLLCGAPLVC